MAGWAPVHPCGVDLQEEDLSSSESRRMALEPSPLYLSLLGVFIESKL